MPSRYHPPFQQAEALYRWGRALLASGDLTRALEKFDAAIDIYRTRGAGEPFVERILADRKRAE